MKHLNRIWLDTSKHICQLHSVDAAELRRSEAFDRNLSLDFPVRASKARDNRNFAGRSGKSHRLSMPPASLE